MLIELFYIGMPVVRTDGRSGYGHVTTKIFGCIGYQIFLPMVLRCACFARPRAPLQNYTGDNSEMTYKQLNSYHN